MALQGKHSKAHTTALVPTCSQQASRAREEGLYTKLAKEHLTCSLLALRMAKDLNGRLHRAKSYGAVPCRLRRDLLYQTIVGVDRSTARSVYNMAQQSASIEPSRQAYQPCAAGRELSVVSALHDTASSDCTPSS